MNPIQQTFTQAGSGTAQRAEVSAPQVPAGRSGGVQAGGAPAASAGETVSISESARQLLASTAAQGGSSASPQRLDALRQAIASGTYNVNAQHIARGLLRDSQALAAIGMGGGGGSGS